MVGTAPFLLHQMSVQLVLLLHNGGNVCCHVFAMTKNVAVLGGTVDLLDQYNHEV